MSRRAITPGHGVTFAGTDISAKETVLWRGERLSSRETGVLAAIGKLTVPVFRQPVWRLSRRATKLSNPDGRSDLGRSTIPMAAFSADAVREMGAQPCILGIVARRCRSVTRNRHDGTAKSHDVILLSGGTSKGTGDISYRVVRELAQPGIVAHGIALKPGKPVCLAAHEGKPVVVLPGFPTSAIFTFHEFVAPVIRRLAGQ